MTEIVAATCSSGKPGENKRTYNPNKGGKDSTQRREEVEKTRKQNHLKKGEQSPFASFLAFLSVFALGF
ncbi:MAG: hypothetical protein OEL80_00110 [Desulfuromonadales bacterium]|nr:hypothetical protein [Desulfuromonadales bacterium]